jgi:hypothetical protein
MLKEKPKAASPEKEPHGSDEDVEMESDDDIGSGDDDDEDSASIQEINTDGLFSLSALIAKRLGSKYPFLVSSTTAVPHPSSVDKSLSFLARKGLSSPSCAATKMVSELEKEFSLRFVEMDLEKEVKKRYNFFVRELTRSACLINN